MNELELKVQALLEKIGNIVASYENQVADLRVELTLLSKKNEELESEIVQQKED